jgi:hypothetical protein
MKANLISMNILVDSSGSMATIASDMVGSLNQLVNENRELDFLVTYSVFADTYQPIFADRPIKEVAQFDLKPNGRTALIESACKMIDEVGVRLGAMPEVERPEKVMFVIVTDGEENASVPEYTLERLKEKIKHQTDVYNWLFLYLGANQNAISVAQQYGITPDKAINYKADQEGMRRYKEMLARKMQQVSCAAPTALQNVAWDDEDRKK